MILLLSLRHDCGKTFSTTRYCQIHTTSTEETETVQLWQKKKTCHGGGALVAVSSTYCSKRRLDLETDLEIVWTLTRLMYNYRKAGFTVLRHLLHSSPWSLLTDTNGIDEGFDLFYDFVYAAINE